MKQCKHMKTLYYANTILFSTSIVLRLYLKSIFSTYSGSMYVPGVQLLERVAAATLVQHKSMLHHILNIYINKLSLHCITSRGYVWLVSSEAEKMSSSIKRIWVRHYIDFSNLILSFTFDYQISLLELTIYAISCAL